MKYQELIHLIENIGKDPSRLIFEDELTGIYNRRFLFNFFRSKIRWDKLKDEPVSLIMIDVDHFKQINDSHGHQVGDEVLIWIAKHLKAIAVENTYVIRYAGDEFIMLLQNSDKQTSIQTGNRLIQRVRKSPFYLKGKDSNFNITVSLGIASAPSDAKNSKTLIHEADTALYYAKKKGRDCLVSAGEVVQKEVFSKKAIFLLESSKMLGREWQLSVVSDSLKKFSLKKSQFLIIEGTAGLGKSEFLKVIKRNLVQEKFQVLVKGVPLERFHPYYLTTKILLDILNQREDKGAAIFESLPAKEAIYLAQVLPYMGGAELLPKDEDETKVREGIFNALVKFIPKLVENSSLILLIDDLHFGDEATLILLRQLILSADISLFICGTAMDSAKLKTDSGVIPLNRFYSTYRIELGIHKISLTPLNDVNISKYIQGIFPNVQLPKDFEKKIEEITRGNPLFLNEILRKLVLDQKITIVGQQWVIQSMGKDYIPKSLEEIISQKIASLDEESRQLLDQISAFGEDVPLSMLMGSTKQMEAKVLEFVDRATDYGLLRSSFQLNDEMISFPGKSVQEIAYDDISQERKLEIHERIGKYQERLYRQHLLTSVAPLAYHFGRSDNQEKARNYKQIQMLVDSRNFNAQEAASYAGFQLSREEAADVPLTPEDLPRIPTVIRSFVTAVNSNKIYPPGSKAIINANKQLKDAIDQILENNRYLNIVQIKKSLVINGQKLHIPEFQLVAYTFLNVLDRFELKGIAFQRGLTEQELEVIVEKIGRTKQKSFDERYWERFTADNKLKHIDLKQVRYIMTGKTQNAGGIAPAVVQSIPKILREILGITKTIKLYSFQSKAVANSVKKLLGTLQIVLKSQPVVTLSKVSNTLLVNGEKMDTSNFILPADRFMKFLDFIGLRSLTFLDRITEKELLAFFGGLSELPTTGGESKTWKRFAKEHTLKGILFDEYLYESRVALAEGASNPGQTIVQALQVDTNESIPEELFEEFLEKFPGRIREMLVKGDEENIQKTILRLFTGFSDREFLVRGKVIDTCAGLFESLSLAYQNDFAEFMTVPLLAAFEKENDPKMTFEIGTFLYRIAMHLIQLTEYSLASRILTYLSQCYNELKESEDVDIQLLGKYLERKLSPKTQRLLVEDLKSDDPSLQQNAAKLLSSLGAVAIPLLGDVIKEEKDYRTREIAAILLKEYGPEAIDLLKRELSLEITAEERARILDVIDTLTHDLKAELAQTLCDENSLVCKAAFRLAERLNNKEVEELLLEYAKSPNPDLATTAIKSLGKLKTPMAVEGLISLLNSIKGMEQKIACCRALGQKAQPESIEPLAKILKAKHIFPGRYKYNAKVRAAAALALRQISHPRVVEILRPVLNDRDPRLREIAYSVVKSHSNSIDQ